MNIRKLISGGMMDAYCLGITSKEENDYVETLALHHPEILHAIERKKELLGITNPTETRLPRPAVKQTLMRRIYRQQCDIDKKFIPLMDEQQDFNNFCESYTANVIQNPTEDFENLYALPLPSTREVTNIAVWVKQGQDEEVHTDIREYIAVLKGSCDMFIDGKRTAYKAGQIVEIPINVVHYGVVTSAEPMIAIVQRQTV